MSFWQGINSWFNRYSNNPYTELKSSLASLNAEIIPAINAATSNKDTRVVREELSELQNRVIDFNERLKKITFPKNKIIAVARNPDAATQFFPIAEALNTAFNSIFRILKKARISIDDKVKIIDALNEMPIVLDKLKELSDELEQTLMPPPFIKANAINPFGARANGNTVDGVPIADIIRVANGLGLDVRRGAAHNFNIDLRDGMPCALGAHSTSFDRHIKGRLARAAHRTDKEVEELFRAV